MRHCRRYAAHCMTNASHTINCCLSRIQRHTTESTVTKSEAKISWLHLIWKRWHEAEEGNAKKKILSSKRWRWQTSHDVLSSPSFNWFLSGCWVTASNFIVMERNRFKWTWWRDAVRQRCHLKLEAGAHDVHSSIQHENGSSSVVGRAHDANINMCGHLFWTNAAPVEEIYITHRNYIWLLSFAYAITVIISFYLPSCFDDVVVVSGGRLFR